MRRGPPVIRHMAGLLTGRLYAVRGDSMKPSFRHGDHLLVSRLAYRVESHRRGEVVIVCDPRRPSSTFLKRIVGLPGEVVRIQDGLLLIDGDHLAEPYLGGLPASPGTDEATWTLARDQYLVLGDNRAHSTDSRHFGPVDRGLIIGGAWFRFWPPRRWGSIEG